MPKVVAGPLPLAPMPARAPRGGVRLVLATASLASACAALVLWGWPATLLETRVVEGCDAGERACSLDLPGGGRVEFDLAPRPLRASEPLRIQVALSGLSAREVEVNMSGVVMAMAETRTRLLPRGEGRFQGELSLPVCSSGPMDWRAEVRVRGWWRSYLMPFRFRSGLQ